MTETTGTQSGEMSFFEHLTALRPHLVRSVIALFVFMIVAFLGKRFIMDTVLMGPQSADFPINRFFTWVGGLFGSDSMRFDTHRFEIINTSMAGQFMLHLKISIITALIITMPYLVWEVWRFVKPALTAKELRGSRMFVLYVSLCFFTGLLFGYYIIAPISVNFFINHVLSETIVNMIDIKSYLNTVINVSFSCAVVFQLPLVIFFLAKMGILTAEFLRKYRRHSLVVLMILAAFITPPDLFSLILVTLPLYGLYELGIKIAARVERKKAEDEEADRLSYPATTK